MTQSAWYALTEAGVGTPYNTVALNIVSDATRGS